MRWILVDIIIPVFSTIELHDKSMCVWVLWRSQQEGVRRGFQCEYRMALWGVIPAGFEGLDVWFRGFGVDALLFEIL